MKKLLIIFLMLICCGCAQIKNDEYYLKIANIAVSTFNNQYYDSKKIDSNDLEAIDNYISEITHTNQIVNLNNYITKNSYYATDESNSINIDTKNNNCLIKYSNINFTDHNFDSMDHEMEKYYRFVCNGYWGIIYESDLYPNYSITQSNPVYNYVLVNDLVTDYKREYLYNSTYDGSTLLITLNINDKNVESISSSFTDTIDTNIDNNEGIVIPIVIIISLIVVLIIGFIVYKFFKSRNI